MGRRYLKTVQFITSLISAAVGIWVDIFGLEQYHSDIIVTEQ